MIKLKIIRKKGHSHLQTYGVPMNSYTYTTTLACCYLLGHHFPLVERFQMSSTGQGSTKAISAKLPSCVIAYSLDIEQYRHSAGGTESVQLQTRLSLYYMSSHGGPCASFGAKQPVDAKLKLT